MIRFIVLAAGLVAGCASTRTPSPASAPAPRAAIQTVRETMELGNFSVSLSVKSLPASRAFYEKLGFRAAGGDGQSWIILQNSTATIGLFQRMFEKNTLTFNPGWDRNCATLASFEDVRDIQRRLVEQGLTPVLMADESTTGPASFVVVDPDGNPVLFDQHVAKKAK